MRKKKNRYRSERMQRRATIRRSLKAIFRVAAFLAGIVLLSAALARSYHALLASSWLRVEEVQISGLQRVERFEILNALMVPRGAGMLDFKVSDLAARLESHPWLTSSRVRIEMPGRILVDVTERKPLAVVQADDLLLLDTEGRLFMKTTLESNPGLLLVNGFYGMNLQEGDSLGREPLEALRGLLAVLTRLKNRLPLDRFSECQWRAGTGFILVAAQGGVPIQIGMDNFDMKLERLQRLWELLESRQWTDLVTRIDLDYSNRAYVEGHFPLSRGG